MGRKKSLPVRSGGLTPAIDVPNCSNAENGLSSEPAVLNHNNKGSAERTKTIFIDVDRSTWGCNDHFDIAEVVLKDVQFMDGQVNCGLIDHSFRNSNYSLRIRLSDVSDDSFRLGQWPVLSATDNIFLEYLILGDATKEDVEQFAVIFSGTFDGPDESISGLAHLVNLRFLSVRLHIEDLCNILSFRLRIEVLRSAFDACESLLDTVRLPWKRSMIHVMSWIRPEVTTSETTHGIWRPSVESVPDEAGNFGPKEHSNFDVAGFYEAIKPSRNEPMLSEELPDLLPQLRPYQRRAAFWMVQREKGVTKTCEDKVQSQISAPFSVPIIFLDGRSRMFYNPFSGNISMHEASLSYVPGGILADEMGLGKTVELLACIFANRRLFLQEDLLSQSGNQDIQSQIKRQKLERVECICGAASESSKYKGLWVQCDICDAWQHADCVGFLPKKVELPSCEYIKKHSEKVLSTKSKYRRKKKDTCEIVEIDGNYTCPICAELSEAVKVKAYTGATLIVCPTPILSQWHSEIIRHTRSGSLRICIYEGARGKDSFTSLTSQMNELVNANIVLTTYDVLKEDLSHDSDRHDGDRHFLRFQKRYPVVPTLLTRINWWRVCLDEAQMVESNQASVTEMAMRLHAHHRWCITGTPIQRRLDDMYGLLRFLRASPFDVYRWWVEVIRDPYEDNNKVAIKFIHNFFKQIMWRSSKVHVAEELHLPTQEECLSWLTFSSIEEHFYQKQHETCAEFAREVIISLKDDHKRESVSGSSVACSNFLSDNEVAKLIGPLLRLRQACCHPQVGSFRLCSLQQNPLTMEEILEVLIGKARTEGEEALRKIVSALNGLAAISIIENNEKQAVSIYREALALADENSDGFRLDPLLDLHIHHNLAEILPSTPEFSQQCHGATHIEIDGLRKRNTCATDRYGKYYVKRKKTGEQSRLNSTRDHIASLEQYSKECDATPCFGQVDEKGNKDSEVDPPCCLSMLDKSGKTCSDSDITCQVLQRCYAVSCLKKTSEKIKQKYLSTFNSKLHLAQQEFKNSFIQVSNSFKDLEKHSIIWWKNALDSVNRSHESSAELLKKIEQSVSRTAHYARSSKLLPRFKTLSGLMYFIENGLDSLYSARQTLIDRLMEIDQTMDNPKDEYMERIRYCPICYEGDVLCIHCELDQLFQMYEARLSLVRKASNDAMIASAEEALSLQRKNYELNNFFRSKRTSVELQTGDEGTKQRQVKEMIQVFKFPSRVETALRVVKSFSKTILGKQGLESARKHLLLFEDMRKEFAQARSLSKAQAQLLRAYDEIKMATTRLCLKESENEPFSVNLLSREELIQTSMELSSEKFISLSSLQRIKGQLRYLKRMVLSNKNNEHPLQDSSSKPLDTVDSLQLEQSSCKKDDELCPICHDRILNEKMVFECGHIICCKCCLEMTEYALGNLGQKRVNCPTCRQPTDLNNIAYVDEKQKIDEDSGSLFSFQVGYASESSVKVKGSYGTKIEAITRRILWITLNDREAKILVFSNWNDVLDVMGHALGANDISYVRMKGGRKSQVAISQFKGQSTSGDEETKGQPSKSKPVQVLMMLIQHGANGLNLLEAQHVILVEPLLNPAAEAQAISRIHRVGQDKKTFVHRFLVKNSIEESIYKLNANRRVSSFISSNTIKKDQPALTLEDVESLFSLARPSEGGEQYTSNEQQNESLRNLPPAVAAGLAAQRRLMEGQNS